MIVPLRDDCAERYSAFRLKWAKRWDGGRGLLRKALLHQLSLRPDIEYKDLWTDEEERRTAARCMRVCKEMFGLPNERLVLNDPLEMLLAIDEDGFIDFLRALEREFRLDLMCGDVVDKTTTLGGLVRYVHEHQGMLTLAETCKRDRLGWGCSAFLWFLSVGVIAGLYSDVTGMIEAVRYGDVRWQQILGLVFSLLGSSVAIVVAWSLITSWLKERKELREEREKLEKAA